MGNLIKGIVIIGIVLLVSPLYAVECQRLSDAELEAVSAGKFLDLDMMAGMIEEMMGKMIALAGTGTLVNINALNSATEVWTSFNSNVEEVVEINSHNAINQAAGSSNILTISDSAQDSLQALININAVNSATVVQTNFNSNVGSVTTTNTATVINSH